METKKLKKKSAAKKIAPKKQDSKTKTKKEEWVTISALVGSIIFTPKEIAQSKKNGIDLLLVLKNIQEKTKK